MYRGDTLAPQSHRMSSSTLSNNDKFFNRPTHASVSHLCSVKEMSRCTFDCDQWPDNSLLSAGLRWSAPVFFLLTASAYDPLFFPRYPLCCTLRFVSLLSSSFDLVYGHPQVTGCGFPWTALPNFGMLTNIFSPPKTMLSNFFSNCCKSSTPLNLTKPYLLPFLFLFLAMNTSLTSPAFLKCCHNASSVVSSGNRDYELDGVDWTKVDFEDNEVCLDLFEKKPHGLLSLLDEESNLAKASDLTFANKLKHHLNANPCFKGEKGRAFRVRHYAGEVLYDTNGFLEKNRDMLSSDSIQFLSSCNCELLQLFSKMFNQSQMQSVATKFKVQLFMLMHQLESTTPHFIRCIKPNTKQLPGIFDEVLVLQQLRCCEVLEVVRVSRAGYPTRMAHQEFSRRYGFLLSEANVLQDPLSISVAVLQKFNIPSEMYHVGYTKLYLRAGQIDSLENKRKQVLQGILGIQKCFRGHRARVYFCELKNGVTTLQSFIRGENTRRKYGVTVKSSVTIYSRILEEIHAIILLQSVIRGWLVRRGDASHINRSKRYPENAKPRWKSFMKIIPEVKPDLSKEPVQNLLSALADLQRRVDKADAIVKQKEDENTELREQLKQSERKRIEYETKMKSMEEAWQKQMASLQMSLVAARKSLAPENASVQPVRRDFVLPRGYDSEDATSMGSRTPGGSTPMLSGSLSASDAGRQVNGTLTTVGNLMKEFEQERQNFDDEVKALNDVKPEQSANTNSFEELRKLKQRFEGWKNQYKVRLRETKTRLYKSETEKSRRTWWGKLSSKA
ncbi:Myosin-2 isoform B [Glycine soja]|uniref:Myosin-2 isoform B n=1 Tax=Glycine soja TaxID=3848 RepID=A0A445HQH4_GLYSO|nr:Myosin-2 isoform B [Glycine soja]